jgi:hypothetical protein
LFAGVLFLVAHASYMLFSAHRKRTAAETDALEASRKDLPAKIERHGLTARLFHWVMAAAMFVLLFTAFLPVVGVKFPWVQWHWIAGLVLTASIVFHIIHATFWLDFWSIWVGPKDIPEMKAELLREFGHDVPARSRASTRSATASITSRSSSPAWRWSPLACSCWCACARRCSSATRISSATRRGV